MKKKHTNISSKIGQPPGTLIHVGKHRSEKVKISVIDYNAEIFLEQECKTVEETFAFNNSSTVSWINIDGLHDTSIIAKIGDYFGLHPLLQEDILNTRHRPKLEDFEDYLFLTLKMHSVDEKENEIITEQVSFVLGDNWILSFQERPGDVFDALRKRLRENKGNARKRGADYLLYRLVDTVVDNYFFVTEHFSEVNENIEESVLNDITSKTLQEIQQQKKKLINYRKSISPLREAVGNLQKDNNKLIKIETTRYFRDVYEHIIQANESLETQKEMIGNIMDLYYSGVSNKMNKIMQVLTVISTIFIPLSFIVGVYGMNFDDMPELHWKNGYFMFWGFVVVVISVMLYYFNKKKWL